LAQILADAEAEQLAGAKKIIPYDNPPFDGKYVIGIDVSYSDSIACGCGSVMDFQSKEIVHLESLISTCKISYIPGFFFLREGPIIIELLKRIKHAGPLLIDGNGILHPRRCGLASQVGIKMNRQTIGVAKSLLLGTMGARTDDIAAITESGEQIGTALWLGKKKKPVFVSIGHRLSLETAVNIVKATSIFGYPEPLRQAHLLAKKVCKIEEPSNRDYT
jgi:deoxyinosine 3'endonuclease (endonuclease V)